jgi:CheY-like chemotaxis protein
MVLERLIVKVTEDFRASIRKDLSGEVSMSAITLGTGPQKHLKVLVIEDDTLTRITLCRVLRKLEYITFEACNGFMGLVQFKREQPDVVITDIVMPDKEGLATILAIRALDPNARIIAMSSGADQNWDFLERAKEVGAARTLRKPFLPDDIRTLMQEMKGPTA